MTRRPAAPPVLLVDDEHSVLHSSRLLLASAGVDNVRTLADGREGYTVVLGGGSDGDKGLARPLCGPVPATQINALVGQLVACYLERRRANESFLAFIRALSDDELPGLIDVQARSSARLESQRDDEPPGLIDVQTIAA